jgi:pimeloyl-ACP methyl ester carboxylesterase
VPETDLYLEPGDIAFGIHALERTASSTGQWLHGLVNVRAVVLAGHSDGGSAVAALVYDSSYAQPDLAVRGVAVLSGAEFPIAKQTYAQPSTGAVPLLVVQSAADRCDAPSGAVQLYNAIGAPKSFDELTSASHLGAVNGTNADAFAVVQRTTAVFFAAAIGTTPRSESQLAAAGSAAGVASLVSISTVAPIPAPPGGTVCPAD